MGQTAQASETTLLIPVDRIDVVDGFNPRSELRNIGALAASILGLGQLQPGIVRPVGERYELVSGHRRFAAVVQAGLTVFRAEVCEDDAPRREVALAENEQRDDLNAVEVALALKALKDEDGLAVKEIAQRTGRSQAEVRNRLALAGLDERVQANVASGAIPLGAVKTLVTIAGVSVELAARVAEGVAASGDAEYGDRVSAQDLLDLGPAVASYFAGADHGVYRLHCSYQLAAFDLSKKAAAQVEDLRPFEHYVSFDAKALDRAKAYGCALVFAEGDGLICDRAFASELASELVLVRAKVARKERREREKVVAEREAAGAAPGDGPAQATSAAERTELTAEERAQAAIDNRRATLEQAKKDRAAAIALNDELGAVLFRDVAKVKIDERVVELLALSGIGEHGAAYAMRGLRYTHPGWKTVETPDKVREKRTYPDMGDCGRKLQAFLLGAKGPQQLAARQLQVLFAALLADDHEVAMSNRGGSQPPTSGGYSGIAGGQQRTKDLLAELIGELIPEAQVKKAMRRSKQHNSWNSLEWLRPKKLADVLDERAAAQPAAAPAAAEPSVADDATSAAPSETGVAHNATVAAIVEAFDAQDITDAGGDASAEAPVGDDQLGAEPTP